MVWTIIDKPFPISNSSSHLIYLNNTDHRTPDAGVSITYYKDVNDNIINYAKGDFKCIISELWCTIRA